MKNKISTLLWLSSLIYFHAVAQPVLRKQIAAGGNGDNFLHAICLTVDKGWIAGGYSNANASCDKTENNRGTTDTYDYWVIKYDSSGKKQWDKTVGGSNNDYLINLQQTMDGGYILGGYSNSCKSGEKTQNSRGDYDYWIVKLDKAGKVEWNRTIGGDGYDELRSLQQTIDGGYIISGGSTSGVSGEKTGPGIGAWIVKMDKAGKIQWNKVINDGAGQIRQTKDGGYIFWSNNLIKLGSKGNIRWSKKIDAPDIDGDAIPDPRGGRDAVEQTEDGGYILGGGVKKNYEGGQGYWVLKTDRKGNTQWSRTFNTYNSDGYDELASIEQTQDLGYILGGTTDKPYLESDYDDDYWVVKLDTSGNMEWNIAFGGNVHDDECVSVKEMGRNHYLVGGWSESGVEGSKTIEACGEVDFWLVKLFYKDTANTTITAVSNEHGITVPAKSTNFIIRPNPVKDMLNVQVEGTAVVSLTDGAGRTLLTQTITNSGSINVSRLQAGMYYLQNRATGETKKVFVTH